jgi:hypothetical protein
MASGNEDRRTQSIQKLRSSVEQRFLRIEDVRAAIGNRFGIHPHRLAFTHANTMQDIYASLADHFGKHPGIDRVMFEFPTGPTTWAMAGLNCDTNGKWWPVGIDEKTLQELRSKGVVDPDGSVPDAVRFLVLQHKPLMGGDPQQMRLALLTLTAGDRVPLQLKLSQHLENAVPPHLHSPRPLSPEAPTPPPVAHAASLTREQAFLHELTGGVMPHVGPAPAGAQVTIQQAAYERAYEIGKGTGCALTALSNHLGVVVPPRVMPQQPGGGNLLDDLSNAAYVLYRVNLIVDKRPDGLRSAAPQYDVCVLLANSAIDRITYRIGSPQRPGFHFATLTRNAGNEWVLHDRDDTLAIYAKRFPLTALQPAAGGSVLVLGSADEAQKFWLTFCEVEKYSTGGLEWFASHAHDRAEVAKKQEEYLLHAAGQWCEIKAACAPERRQRLTPAQLSKLSDGDCTDRSIDRFLRLLEANFETERMAKGPWESRQHQREEIMRQTVADFKDSFPRQSGGVIYKSPQDLAKQGRGPWDVCVTDFIAGQRTKKGDLRRSVLLKYERFLLTGVFHTRA